MASLTEYQHTPTTDRSMQPALNAPMAEKIPMPVSDADFKKLVAVIRCAVPYTGGCAAFVWTLCAAAYTHQPSTTPKPHRTNPNQQTTQKA